MPNTESLIVELELDNKQFNREAKESKGVLVGLGDAANDADGKTKRFSVSANAAGTAIKALGAAVGVATVATVAYGRAVGMSLIELENQARLAGVTADEFRELAFVYGTVGLSAEKFGDQSKDAAEKVGEFAAELRATGRGAGGLMDFMTVMGFTEQQIKDTSDAMQQMNSDEILQFMVTQMQEAGVSTKEMSFALEGVASDATALIPLLLDNGKAAKELKEQFRGINNELSDKEKQNYKDFAVNMTLVETSFKSFMSNALAPFLPMMNDATKAVAEFFAEWNAELDIDRIGEQIKSGTFGALLGDIDTDKEAQAFKEKLDTLISNQISATEAARSGLEGFESQESNLLGRGGFSQEDIDAKKDELEQKLELEQQYLEQLSEAYSQFNEQQEEIKVQQAEQTEEEDKIQKRRDENQAMLEADIELDELMAEIDQDEYDRREELRAIEMKSIQDHYDSVSKIKDASAKAQMKLDKSITANAIGLLTTLGKENKAFALVALGVQKAQALSANATATASGSMLAYASQLVPGDPTSIARAELARDYTVGLGAVNAGLIVATGLAEAGGIVSGGGGGFNGGSSSGDTQSQQEDFTEDTNSLEVTEASVGGSTVQDIRIIDGGDSELITMIAEKLVAAKNSGQIEL